MLINLHSKKINNEEIEFDLPTVYFNRNDVVYVTELFIKWKSQVKNIYGYISSSLIDKCPVNMDQQLLFFYHKKVSHFTYWSPTHVHQYKIQCLSLKSSVFKIVLSGDEEKEKNTNITDNIEKIYLQVKVNGSRVQSGFGRQ